MAIICFDVDNTVIPSGDLMGKWLAKQQWFQDCFESDEQANEYATTRYTPWEGINLPKYWQEKAMAWWKQEGLFDDMRPTDEVMAAIESIHQAGHTVVFASHVEGAHAKSKVQCLKRWFPYMEAFLATRQKHFVRCDYLVDDRASNLIRVSADSRIVPVYLKTQFDDDKFKPMLYDFINNGVEYKIVDSIKEFSEFIVKE